MELGAIGYEQIINLRIKTDKIDYNLENALGCKFIETQGNITRHRNPITLYIGGHKHLDEEKIDTRWKNFYESNITKYRNELEALMMFNPKHISNEEEYKEYCLLSEEERFKLYCKQYINIKNPRGDTYLG